MRPLWLRARCFAHATEDEERVRSTLAWVLQIEGPEGRDRINRARAKGHWGNDILVFEGVLKSEDAIEACQRHVFGSPSLREVVVAAIEKHLDDDGVLHVRLDKQAAVEHRIAPGPGGDAIVVTIKREAARGGSLAAAWTDVISLAGS